jgi:UDP-N-acetylmuramoyl-L-alanyl-D-glutamate--2,6-diaminopimelate ligase
MARSMSLTALCQGLGQCQTDAIITGLTLDSRAVRPGDAFIALDGARASGVDFIEQAVNLGASAIIAGRAITVPLGVGAAVIAELSGSLAELAARFYQTSIRRIPVIAVTGTNGKTSTVNLVAQLLTLLGYDGTLNTTPDVVTAHRWLAEVDSDGADLLALEASSHGLHQGRLTGIPITTAAITNITQDHLDYHGTMEAYTDAKALLLDWPTLETVVLDLDCARVASLRSRCSDRLRVIGFSLRQAKEATVQVAYQGSAQGSQISLSSPWGDANFTTSLVGEFYVRNLVAALLVLLSQGFELVELSRVASQVQGVPGRLQQVEGAHDIAVFIDYAHTPDAIAAVLSIVRPLTQGKLWIVFGCGGDRDPLKRPMMGRAAAEGADYAILTNDNPRSEAPAKIIADIVSEGMTPFAVCLDRTEAISRAVLEARSGDTVVIAGKGHEQEQVMADGILPFCDYSVASQALSLRARV